MIHLDVRHYCATLLHPDYRSLRGCLNVERVTCHNCIREQLKLLSKEDENNNNGIQTKIRFKTKSSSILDDFKDNPDTFDNEYELDDEDFDTKSIEYSLPSTQSDELSRYLSMKIDMKYYSSDVLMFWKSTVNELPYLFKLARQIHSIPATSAAVERQFSIAGLTLTNRRSSSDPEQLDNILCIRAVQRIGNHM